jgi:hypothetical protein
MLPIMVVMGVTKIVTSSATATGDTVKTLIDTLTVPIDAKAIVGVFAYAAAAATLTTGEAISGILELESDDMNISPFKIPLEVVTVLTNGAVAYNPRIWPVNIPVTGGAKIKGSMTMDMAQTAALKGRFGLIYDV